MDCGPNADCVGSTNGVPSCQCHAGYVAGVDDNICIDIDECLDPATDCPTLSGEPDSKCVNAPGSFGIRFNINHAYIGHEL